VWEARQQDTGKLEASSGVLRYGSAVVSALDWLSEFLVITGFSEIQITDGAVQPPAAVGRVPPPECAFYPMQIVNVYQGNKNQYP